MTLKEEYQRASPKGKREIRTTIARGNSRYPEELVVMSEEQMPNGLGLANFASSEWMRFKVLRSRTHLVQMFRHQNGIIRMSVNSTTLNPRTGDWVEIKGWDLLFHLKNTAGYADRQAVEVFPPAEELIDVANMRHLWILPAKIKGIDLQHHDAI